MLKHSVLALVTLFVGALCLPALAVPSSDTPEAVLRAIVAYDRKGGETIVLNRTTVTPVMKRLISTALARDWIRSCDVGENNFDANAFTGRPSDSFSTYSDFRIVSESDTAVTIAATLVSQNEDGPRRHTQHYRLIKEGGAWRLDEIIYTPDAPKPSTLHASAINWIATEGAAIAAARAKMLGTYEQKTPALMTMIITQGRGDSVKAEISVGTDGCSGGIDIIGKIRFDGMVVFTKKTSVTTCEIDASFSKDYCSVSLNESGCMPYHGFSCGFDGKVTRTKSPVR
ncbi:hypothetical protein ACFZ8E_02555 [Methylobacterium sp. HMF5984]|uniref:hypothetical protein n=1 Tax=Methylobacterium sp. HMF5984 TaxID=3367370 RepID=UPI003851C679